MTTNKKTIKDAVLDVREEFLAIIYKDYPNHQKVWKAEDVEKAFSSAMYSIACAYLDRAEKKGRNE